MQARSILVVALGIGLAGTLTALAADLARADETGDDRPTASIPAEDDELPGLTYERPSLRSLSPEDLPPPNVFSPRRYSRPAFLATGRWRPSRSEYRAIIEREAQSQGVPAEIVEAVMTVESGNNPAAIGADGEIGLMQIMPSTARMLGFVGTHEQLSYPENNIHYGVKYLAGAWRLGGQDICTATMKYRAGHGETRFSYKSVSYCVRVRSHLAARGFAVTGRVPEPTFGSPGGASVGNRSLRYRNVGSVNLAGLNTRLRELTFKINPRDFR